ncbi:MAG: hypothetical protein PHT69_00340 [Bacteroidales bacterium]|nr:hypothetical protein [Bacteroidales bacterium]
MQKLKFFLTTEFIPSSRGKVFFFVIALLFNLFWLNVAKTTHNPDGKEIFFRSGVEMEKDLFAAENFIEHGSFYFGKNFRGEEDFTYRMPGQLFVYLPFRLFLSIENTMWAFVIFNLLLGALASVLLALIVLSLTKDYRFFYLAFILFLGSGYVQHYNFGAGREATTTYIMVIAFYLFINWLNKRKIYQLLLFSLLLTWCILYRPFMGLPIFLIFGIIIIKQWKSNQKFPLKSFAILFLPSFLFFSYWIPRNYILTKRFIPLETVYLGYAHSYRAISVLVGTWAGETLPWVKNSEAAWFNPAHWNGGALVNDSVLPDFLFNDVLTLDTLKKARNYYWFAHDTANYTFEERILWDTKATAILDKFISFQREEYPFRAYLGAKMILLSRFLYQPIGIPVKTLKYPLNVFLAFTSSFINLLLIIGGFIASFVLIFKRNKDMVLTFSLISALYLTLLFPLFFDIELRRIAHAIPFLLVNILCVVKYSYHKYKKATTIFSFLFFFALIYFSVLVCKTYINW